MLKLDQWDSRSGLITLKQRTCPPYKDKENLAVGEVAY